MKVVSREALKRLQPSLNRGTEYNMQILCHCGSYFDELMARNLMTGMVSRKPRGGQKYSHFSRQIGRH